MRSFRINCSLATEYALIHENICIQNERITQLYVIQAEQNPFLWFGILFVDHGIYKGAILRFNMYIDETYPDCSCPKIVFDPIPFHPLVNPTTGELDTKNAFPNWNSNVMKLYELLLFIKRVIRQADSYIVQIRDLFINSMISHEEDTSQEKEIEGVEKVVGEQSVPPGSQRENTNERDNQCKEDRVIKFKSNISAETFPSSLKKMFTWFNHTFEFVKIYEDQHEQFLELVEKFKAKCFEEMLTRPALCGDDRNALVFTPWNQALYEPMRSHILSGRFTPTSLFASYNKDTDSVSFIPGHEPSDDQ